MVKYRLTLGIVNAGLVTLGLLCSASFGQSVVIYPGSPGDAGYSAGTTAYTIPQFIPLPTLPPGSNSTLRYGQSFNYTLQVPVAGMYVILMGFVEPCTPAACGGWIAEAGQRVFSVWANDQPLLQNLDVFAEAGALAPLTKAAVVYIPGQLTLSFAASVRNAVISLIVLSGVGITDGPIAWCVANPQCSGMGLATLASKTGTPTPYFLIPTGPAFTFLPMQWQ